MLTEQANADHYSPTTCCYKYWSWFQWGEKTFKVVSVGDYSIFVNSCGSSCLNNLKNWFTTVKIPINSR